MILGNINLQNAILFHWTQYKLILHNVKSLDAILFHGTQYKIMLLNMNHRTHY